MTTIKNKSNVNGNNVKNNGTKNGCKTTARVQRDTKRDLQNLSPFYFSKELRNLSRKNEFCDNINLSLLAKRLFVFSIVTGDKTPFNVNLLHRDNNGKVCRISGTKFNGVYDTDGDEITYKYKGKDVINGYVYTPISDLISYANVFSELIKDFEKAVNTAQKAYAAKMRAKIARQRAMKAIKEKFVNNIISYGDYVDGLKKYGEIVA